MNKYLVKIGSLDHRGFGGYTEAKSFEDLKNKILLQIENLHPLNASPEGAIAYRERFQNKPIFAKELYSKGEYKQIYFPENDDRNKS